MLFEFIGNYNVSEMVSKINFFSEEEWLKNQNRQKKFLVHKHTQTIPLLYHNIDDENTSNVFKWEYYNIFKKNINEINEILKNFYKIGNIKRCILVKMNPNSVILPHVDTGKGLINTNRIHIPIITNDLVLFTITGIKRCENINWQISPSDITEEYKSKILHDVELNTETKILKTGEVWEINNAQVHSVINKSDKDRVHLIIDWNKND